MALETSTGELLRVSGLTASVDEKEILHGIDLSVAQGETHVLMGPNGAGKSTLGHVVMGDPTYNVTAGSIVFNGQDVTTLSPDKRSHAGMFLSFQAPVEIPGVPLSSFLRAAAAGREGLNLKGKQFRKHTQELCEELDFDPAYLDRELGVGFSGGEKKKLEMLQLLLLKPKLIIITHNTRILERVDVDRVHVMVKGRMVHEGPASLIEKIDTEGFEQFEQAAQAAQA